MRKKCKRLRFAGSRGQEIENETVSNNLEMFINQNTEFELAMPKVEKDERFASELKVKMKCKCVGQRLTKKIRLMKNFETSRNYALPELLCCPC